MDNMRTPPEGRRVAETLEGLKHLQSIPRAPENQVDLYRDLDATLADHSTDKVLREFGVPAEISPLCGLATVQSHGPFFEFHPEGTPAIIHPVFEAGERVELLAYQPHRPHRFHVLLGACPLLGIDNLISFYDVVRVWRTPLNYLRAGLDGVVVLSWPAAIPQLRCCSELIAEDVDHGDEIRRHLTRPIAIPKISVPAREVAA